MPSSPLNADTKVIVLTQTKVDVLAIDIVKGRSTMAAAIPVLALYVPPGRVDLVNEVMSRVGTPTRRPTGDWPPASLRYELSWRLKRVHCGEVKMTGPDGITVEVIDYIDKMQTRRRVFKVSQYGIFKGEAKDVGTLGKLVDLASLREDGRDSQERAAEAEPPVSDHKHD